MKPHHIKVHIWDMAGDPRAVIQFAISGFDLSALSPIQKAELESAMKHSIENWKLEYAPRD